MVIEQLKLLCIRDEKKISNVLKDIGVSPSNAQRWRNGEKMNIDTLIKLADYFNVSTDYILGREEKITADNIKGHLNKSNLEDVGDININENGKYSKIVELIAEQTETLNEEEKFMVFDYVRKIKKNKS